MNFNFFKSVFSLGEKLNRPTTQLEETLYLLISRESINKRQMMFECSTVNLGERIRQLRHDHCLDIITERVSSINKFKNPVSYGKYTLRNKKSGIKRYKQIQEASNKH